MATFDTRLVFAPRQQTGAAQGALADPAAAGSNHHIRSIGYPILAASVASELETSSLSILVPDADPGVQLLTLAKALPSLDQLAALLNTAISEAYPGFAGELPSLVQRAAGWFWSNPTATDATLTLPSDNIQQLVLGEVSGDTVVIPAGGLAGPYRPDPTLGAFSQTLTFQPGQSHAIELPITGEYLAAALFRPGDEIFRLSTPATTGRVEVYYPSINTALVGTADRPLSIVVRSSDLVRASN